MGLSLAPEGQGSNRASGESVHSADGSMDLCLEPGEAEWMEGSWLSHVAFPPPLYRMDPHLIMLPHGSPLSPPGRSPSILQAGAVGKTCLCDLSQPLGIAWPGKLGSLEGSISWGWRNRQRQLRRSGAAGGAGTLLSDPATKLGTVFSV